MTWKPSSLCLLMSICLASSLSLFGQTVEATSKGQRFDVISIRPSKSGSEQGMRITPDGYVAKNFPLMVTFLMAYFPIPFPAQNPLVGAPAWMSQDSYDVEARVSSVDAEIWKTQDMKHKEVVEVMLQAALAERCKLVAYRKAVEGPAYALVVDKHGPKLRGAKPDEVLPSTDLTMTFPDDSVVEGFRKGEKPRANFLNASMASLVQYLSRSADRPVIDKTGLTGRFDFALISRDEAGEMVSDRNPSSHWDFEELGLKLVPATEQTVRVVIEHIERPSAN